MSEAKESKSEKSEKSRIEKRKVVDGINVCESYPGKLAPNAVSHLGSSSPCVNSEPTCLPMDKVESCKRLALGTGSKPNVAVQRMKAGSSLKNDGLCEVLSKLEISTPVKCCTEGEVHPF